MTHSMFFWIPTLPIQALSAFVPFFFRLQFFLGSFGFRSTEESVASGAVQLTLDGSGELESVQVAPAAESEKPFWKKSPKPLGVLRSVVLGEDF